MDKNLREVNDILINYKKKKGERKGKSATGEVEGGEAWGLKPIGDKMMRDGQGGWE